MVDFGYVFISPHAVAQFQQRIAPLGSATAAQVIREGIQLATNVRRLPDGLTWRVRTRKPFPFEFRAFVVFDLERGHFVVTTITRGDGSGTRKRRRRAKQARVRAN
ncbi:MAG: hypothetical protein ACREAM_17620, partial [Blastocatellia bacterium]